MLVTGDRGDKVAYTNFRTEAHVATPRKLSSVASTLRMRTTIILAVSAMNSQGRFALIGAHQDGIDVGSMNGRTRLSKTLYCAHA